MGRLLSALVILALAGCEPPTDPEAGCGTGPGQIEVGRVVANRLEAIAPDGELPIVPGAQGGIHVLVGVWASAIDLDLTLTYRLRERTSEQIVGLETELALRPSFFDRSGPRPERSPDLLVLDNNASPFDDYVGRELRLEAEAVSSDGSHACDSRLVRLTR